MYMAMKLLQAYVEEEDYKRFKKFVDDSNSDVSKMIRALIRAKLAKRPKYD